MAKKENKTSKKKAPKKAKIANGTKSALSNKKKKGIKSPSKSNVKKAKSKTPKKTSKDLKSGSAKAVKSIKKTSNKKSTVRQTNKNKEKRLIKSKLSKTELIKFQELLIQKIHEILGDVDWIENESLRKSRFDDSGDLSNMPIHMADIGTDNYEQEFSLGLMDSERKLVREILDALRRIELGTYGICEGTGKPIPKARLEANPWARYCVEYASLIEQGKAPAYSSERNWKILSEFIDDEEDSDYEDESDDIQEDEEYQHEEPDEEEPDAETHADFESTTLDDYIDETEEEEEEEEY